MPTHYLSVAGYVRTTVGYDLIILLIRMASTLLCTEYSVGSID
jgi:hypothetical protein